MRVLSVIITLMLAAGCACPDYITIHGIEVYDPQGLSDAHSVEEVAQVWADSFGHGTGHLRGAELHLGTDPIWLDDAIIPTTGSYHKGVITIQLNGDCLAKSSLVHELAHLAQDEVDDKVEPYHNSDEYWHMGDGHAAKAKRLAQELCD